MTALATKSRRFVQWGDRLLPGSKKERWKNHNQRKKNASQFLKMQDFSETIGLGHLFRTTPQCSALGRSRNLANRFLGRHGRIRLRLPTESSLVVDIAWVRVSWRRRFHRRHHPTKCTKASQVPPSRTSGDRSRERERQFGPTSHPYR